jgi:3-hydroxy-9,10-secoandrosta-1,3,5(10)-triene-9,17-dione monooxygenase reductase component
MALTDDFKSALASWASGVAVVTTQTRGLMYGLTVSSFSSVSLDPPLVMVCLAKTNRLPLMIQDGGMFAISILGASQESASAYFARGGREPTDEFVEIDGQWSKSGAPVIAGAAAFVVCKLHDTSEQGDHILIIGEVIEAKSEAGKAPLMYFNRGYRTLSD